MKKTIPVIAVIALLFAVGAVVAMRPGRTEEPPPFPPPTADFHSAVGAVGLVEASTENIAISTAVPGLVTAVYARAGEPVRAGQRLFSLDDRDWQAELRVRQEEARVARNQFERLKQLPRPEEIPPAEARVREAEAILADALVQLQLMESVTDRRAIREEDLQRRRETVKAAEARREQARTELALLKAGAWKEDLEIAAAQVDLAEGRVKRAETEIERLTMRAPIDGVVLQSDVRPGQYAQVGPLGTPLMILGAVHPLHVRVDVDEHDAWRVRRGARAVASPRGNGSLKMPLEFVRFEPYIVPKRSLTGDSTERVDTRVLQVLYRFADNNPSVYVGQQMDVFIEARGVESAGMADKVDPQR